MTIITPLFKKAINIVARPGATVIDIGGGLRISKERGDRYEEASASWIVPLLSESKYLILDPVETYHPDVVGDIHALPFEDDSLDAIVCLSVLEHVEDPMLACREMLRVLKSGGTLFLYVPFLFYYHAEKGYYHDYWRFTEDALHLMLKGFSTVELETSRGAIETLLNLLPFGSRFFVREPARLLDRLLGKTNSKQTGGYYVLAVK